MADDWEKEYEEDMRRAREGLAIESSGRRQQGPDGLPPQAATYNSTSARAPPPDMIRPTPPVESTPPPASDLQWPESKKNSDSMPNPRSVGTSSQPLQLDPRIGLPWVTLPQRYLMLNKKFSSRIFFFDEVEIYEPGTFSKNKTKKCCVVCPNTVYIVNPSNGAITHAAVIYFLKDVWDVKESQVVLRDTEQPESNVWIIFLDQTTRQQFTKVIKHLAAFQDKEIKVIAAPNPTVTLKGGKSPFPIVEDPRSGLTIIPIPEAHRDAFAPLLPKIIHFFGFCNLFVEDWKGAWKEVKVALWITATCVFLSDAVQGPGVDGRHIKRCIGIEFIYELVDGPGGTLGMKVSGGPPQPDVGIVLESLAVKETFLFVLKQVYLHQMKKQGKPMAPHTDGFRMSRVSASGKEGLGAVMTILLPKQFSVEIFQLRTKEELLELLMKKIE